VIIAEFSKMDLEQLSIHDHFSGKDVLLADVVRAHVYQLLKHMEIQDTSTDSKLYSYFLKEMEKGVFSAVLINTRGNQAQACQFLGISRLCLYKKLKKYKRLS